VSSDRGASPIELAMGLMLLVVPVTIIVLSIAPVFEHQNFVRRAASEAARTLVLAQDEPESAALTVVENLAVGMGIDPADVTVVLCGGVGCSLQRGGQVSVQVTTAVRQLSSFLPIGDFTVTATHVEQVDLYRSRP
jgi:Flp pilus assembly protein TadG